jgi:alpha-beta hydrolase superfamily lysophospholipase
VETQLRSGGASDEQVEASLAQQDEFIVFVESSTGEWTEYVAEDLVRELPWMTAEAAEALLHSPLGLSWLRQHYLADTEATLARVTQPLLAVHGDRDAQVPHTEADLVATILRDAGHPDVTAIVLPEVNHLLRYHPEEPNLVYRHIGAPLDARVGEAVSGWILERFAQ